MKIIQNTPEKVVLQMEANESLANAIRRSILEVPTLAVGEVEIFKNDSALYDEIIGHRIGLIPLKTEKSMNEKTKIEFKLMKKGPETVYASDLQGPGSVVFGKMPITILNENHKLELVATATLGIGLEHAKYTPGLCYYRHLLEIKSFPEIDKIIEKSKSLVKPEKKGNSWICDLPEASVDDILKINKSAVSDSDEILFFIESFGQMSAKEILQKAIKTLEKNLDEFERSVK